MRYKHLLDGLEVTVITLQELLKDNFVFRFDAEYLQKQYLLEDKLRSKFEIKRLSTFSFITDGQHGYHEIDEHSPIAHLTAKNFKNWFADRKDADPLAEWVDLKNKRSSLQIDDIMLTTRGTVGCCAIIKQEVLPANIDQDVARIMLEPNSVKPQFLLAYLNSKFGQDWIKRNSTGMVQQGLALWRIKEMPIPILSDNFQKCIVKIIELAYSNIHNSQTAYQTAEHLLLDALGLRGWQPTQANTAIISLSNSFLSSGRLDAEYYQPKYEQLLKKIQSFEHEPLTKLVDIHKSIETGSEAYSDTGIPYVRVSDLTKTGITTPNVHLSEVYYQQHKTLLDKLKIRKNTILLSKDGSIGIAYKVHEDLEMITSGALLHLKINNQRVLPDYLTTVLNSIIVQQQAERDSGGSIIVHWRVAEIEKVIIPILPMPVQQQIATLIQAAQSAQHASKRLLSVAQEAVERAITSGEASALTWIAQNS